MQDTRRDATSLLTRQGLLSDVTSKGLLNLVPEPINQLYTILEQDFSPLHLCQKLAPLLEQLESIDQTLSPASPVQNISLLQYKKSLQQVGFDKAPAGLLQSLTTHASQFCHSKDASSRILSGVAVLPLLDHSCVQ